MSRFHRGVCSSSDRKGGWGRLVAALMTLALLVSACGPRLGPAQTISKAETAFRKGKLEEACDLYWEGFQRAARQELRQRAARGYARCMYRAGRLRAARAKAHRLVEKKGDALSHYLMAFVEIAAGGKGPEQAVRLLEKAAALAPKDPEPVYRLGLLLMEGERFGDACRALRKARDLDGDDPGILIGVARCLAVTGQVDEALVVLRRAAEQRLTKVEVRQGRNVSAYLTDAAAPMSTQGRKVYDRAAELLDKQLPGQASRVLERALDKLGHEPALHRMLGLAHLRLGNNSLAAVSLRRAIRYNPYDGDSAAYLGAFYLSLERHKQAERYLRRACRLAPFNLLAHRSLGQVLMRAGETRMAARVLEKAVNLSAREPATLQLWARALKQTGELEKAVRAVREAVEARPDSYETWMLLGDLYMALYGQKVGEEDSEQHFDRAKEAFRKALELRPGDLKAKQRLQTLDPGSEMPDEE